MILGHSVTKWLNDRNGFASDACAAIQVTDRKVGRFVRRRSYSFADTNQSFLNIIPHVSTEKSRSCFCGKIK